MKKLSAFIVCFFLSLSVFGQGRRLEVLFLGDNGHHRPIDRVPSLMAALGPRGVNVTYSDKLEDLNANTLNKYDALLIFANWDSITPEAEKALLDYVAAGHGLLPIHCASYCFRNSDASVAMMGGQFWRHKMDSIRVEITQPNHPIMQGFKPFTVFDETYLHEKLQADNNVLAVREIKADQKADRPNAKVEPYIWTRTHGKGKVFYTAYGHDERTWNNEGFQDLLYRGILWAVNEEVKTAFEARKPEPLVYQEAKLPNYEQRPGIQKKQLALSPEESMKHIQLPVDFKLELFAAEPHVQHPIAMTWDERGRLFVLVTKDYPNERKPEGGSDYILLCEDTNADGKADKFTKYADGLSIPTGMVFANGGLVVSQAPDMLFLQDTDGDNKVDVKKVLFTGWGTFDTHAGPSNLHYGFDNWVWGCVGYSGFNGKLAKGDSLKFGQAFFRFKPDGSEMEWLTSTSNNTWGFGFNEKNEVFGSTANNSHGWYMAIPHRYFNSANGIDNGSRGTDTHRDMKPITDKVRQVDAFGGFTAAAGHNFYTARAFPKQYWNQIAFVAEPTGHVLHQNNLVRTGTDYKDQEAFNLMAGADEWFAPVFAEVGPDGSVWVADWYSYIIQHNPVPQGFSNGGGNAYETDLRDFTHGRIYRVSYKQAPVYQPVTLSKNWPNELVKTLKNNNMFWRLQAQRLLVERGNTDVVPELLTLLKTSKPDEIGVNAPAIHALWTLHGLGALNEEAIALALGSSSDVIANVLKMIPNTAQSVGYILKNDLLNHKEPLVQLNALLVLSKSPLNEAAEQAFFARLNSIHSEDATDRWLPDAFACVLTANGGKLMKKHWAAQLAKAIKTSPKMEMAKHDHQSHSASSTAKTISNGVDLVVSAIKIEPSNPAARERINVAVEIINIGNTDLPAGTFVPFDVQMEGMGLKIDQTSRNYKEGIKAGETVSINKNINGPWVGTLSFGTDVAGDYNLNISLDPKNEVAEGNERNNVFTKKITFAAPQNLATYALERSLRSYASVAGVDSLTSIIRKSQNIDEQALNSIYKGISEGWNYRIKNVKLSEGDKMFLASANQNNVYLSKILKAWGISTSSNAKHITIKTVREAMKYDLKEITVKAGEMVEITLENIDAMQHNLVIVKPNTLEKVGKAADKMMADPKAAEKQYVPALAEVLFSTPLINPDQSYTLRFTAPTQEGNYPFVCTFPGHWSLMNGMMKVVR